MPSTNTSHPTAGVTWSAEGTTARVVIANPGHLNAISVTMWGQIAQCFSEIAADKGLRVVVVQGAAGAFAAGADIAEFKTMRSNREQVRHYHQQVIAPALAAIAHCPIPVVAAIDGPCVGGGLEIASVCDLRIASDRSRFGVPILRLGFPMAPAEAAGLVGLVGRSVALELLLEGRIFDAQEAYEKAIVNRVVPVSLWQEEIGLTTARISAGAPQAARKNKWLINTLAAIDAQSLLTPMQIESCWDFVDTQDYRRGVEAFLAKTDPRFEDD